MRQKKHKGSAKGRRAYKLLRRLAEIGKVPPINEDFFYRKVICPLYIGLELSQIEEKIASGELPKFVDISESGRAQGYYGSTLLEIKAKRIKEAAD
jgi:hypothetical protein